MKLKMVIDYEKGAMKSGTQHYRIRETTRILNGIAETINIVHGKRAILDEDHNIIGYAEIK
jgi:hypothetical protein